MAADSRTRCEACLSKYRQYSRGRMDTLWSQSLTRKYGIDGEVYREMSKAQANACAICGNQETAVSRHGTPMRLAVDHDHSTGQVRGLLCRDCNTILGKVSDDSNRLRRMADYLDFGVVS